MIVRFPPLDGTTGKSQFLNRLKNALLDEHDVSFTDGKRCDIALTLFGPDKHGYNSKTVSRMNGVYYSSINDPRNNSIGHHLSKCDGIAYQSKFSKKLVKIFVKKYHKFKDKIEESIIYNGADPSFYDEIEPAKSDHFWNVICCARWRRHKRLKEIVKLILDTDICLWVAGDPDYKISHPRIKYLGRIDQKKLGSYYKMAQVMIHLCPYDNCPNSVIEAIAAGTPVLCTNSGGVAEIVGENGIISQIEEPFNFKPTDVNSPPKINMDVLRNDLLKLMSGLEVKRDAVDIKKAAGNYYDLFIKVLNG